MSWFIEVERMRKKGKLSKHLSVSVSELLNLKERLEVAEKLVNDLQDPSQQHPIQPTPASQDSYPNMDKVMQNLQASLDEKEHIIAKLKEELALNQERLLAFAAQLENLSTGGKTDAIEGGGDQISRLQEENYKLETHISQLEMMVTERAETVNQVNNKIQELEKYKLSMEEYVAKLKADSVTKNTHEAALKHIQEQTAHIQALSGDQQRLSSKISELENQLATKDRELKMAAPTMVMTPSLAKPASPTASSTFASTPSISPQSVTPVAPSSTSYDSYYSQEAINKDTNRLVCPHCGASGTKINVVNDKTQMISFSPPVYRKKNVCSQCGFEF